MKIVEYEGRFSHIEQIDIEDLEFIVAAANIAGYMEAAERIHVGSDTELAVAVARILTEYNLACRTGEPIFPEFVQEFLLNRFPIE